MHRERVACALSPADSERRGVAWLFGAFLFCPCHLPITLGILATVFSGTAIGAVATGHPYFAGAACTVAWLAGTWRGFQHLRSARRRRQASDE
jgi:cytochrome c biogenesis protein CcdA